MIVCILRRFGDHHTAFKIQEVLIVKDRYQLGTAAEDGALLTGLRARAGLTGLFLLWVGRCVL